LGHDGVLACLRSLEAEGPAAGPPLWESVVMGSGPLTMNE